MEISDNLASQAAEDSVGEFDIADDESLNNVDDFDIADNSSKNSVNEDWPRWLWFL